jgi:catechol 2,3-dioxygenase-like lactoylglutathione lyase family enzyme
MNDRRDGFYPHTYFHVGIVVPDIDAAIDEMARTLGLDFNEPHDSTYGDAEIRVAYARPGPPFFELVQGMPGTAWDTAAGPRMDHVGYFSADLDADVARLEAAGMPLDIDGREYGARFTYHRSLSSGLRVELIDTARRDALMQTILG